MATILTDGKKTAEIIMRTWSDFQWSPDFSNDFFEVGGLKKVDVFGELAHEVDDLDYCIAQADGFQLGYAQALSDFTEYITDYWNGSDDKPQKSILDAIADLGVELGNRKNVDKDNLEKAKEMGFEGYYQWNAVFEGKRTCVVRLFTKDFDDNLYRAALWPSSLLKTLYH